jgi:hypothetical protein
MHTGNRDQNAVAEVMSPKLSSDHWYMITKRVLTTSHLISSQVEMFTTITPPPLTRSHAMFDRKNNHMSEVTPLSMATEPCCSKKCPCQEDKDE